MRLNLALVFVVLFPAFAGAHHSRAEFSEVVEEITGEIVGARWVNPHPELTLRVSGENETDELLSIQVYGAANNLRQAGVTDELFEIGDMVTIAGQRSTRRESVMLGTHMLLPDGQQAIFSRTLEPYWSVEHLGGLEAFLAGSSELADAEAENRGIFRMWSIEPGRDGTGSVIDFPLTEAAESAAAEFDQEDSWIGRQEAPGMPAFMFSRNNFEFFDDGDAIRYEQAVFGVVRTIHLTESADAAAHAPSPLGYSTGRWEGDTLIVETSRLNWPYLNRSGIPMTQDVRITERFTLSVDQARLDYELTVVDPATFTEAGTMSRYWVALANPTPDERYVP